MEKIIWFLFYGNIILLCYSLFTLSYLLTLVYEHKGMGITYLLCTTVMNYYYYNFNIWYHII
jgi:hypothetical protein